MNTKENMVEDVLNNVVDTDTDPKEIIDNTEELKPIDTEAVSGRPFFSVIIPCHNTKVQWMAELLHSLTSAGNRDDMEIIIVNDRSEETEFLDVVREFNKNEIFNLDEEFKYNNPEDHERYLLNIIVAEVPDVDIDGEVLHCPGNTREVGAQLATGRWITFVDHDDLVASGSLDKVKTAIEQSDEKYIASANFIEIDPFTNEVGRDFTHAPNWMHSKFYNLDNFWKTFDIHFPRNLLTHEDIAISSKCNCLMYKLGILHPLYIEEYVVVWRAWPDSTSRGMDDNRLFIEKHLEEYINSTVDVYMEDFKKTAMETEDADEETKAKFVEFYAKMYIDVILYMYFYMQGFKYYDRHGYDLNNETIIRRYIRQFYDIFNITPEIVVHMVANQRVGDKNEKNWYNAVRESASIATGDIIESETFYDFISR